MGQILRKLLLPLDYLLLSISFLIPRNKKIWCFGSKFGGNAKYLFVNLNSRKKQKGEKYVWIGDEDVVKVRDLGFKAYKRWSLKGLWYSLRAGAYLYNSYPSNINSYAFGCAKRVNLWHGIALKCIDRQIKVGPMVKIYQSKGLINELRYLTFRLRPDVVLSTSPLVTDIFSEAFGVPKSNCIEGVYPRCELFLSPISKVDDFVERYENNATKDLIRRMKQYDYTYIYMPTFRDSGDDFLHNCSFDYEQINEAMAKHNRCFIIKLHPDSKIQLTKEYSNIILVDKDVDIYPVLPYSHCLVTDFSSIYFDYLLLNGKQIILFVPDFNDYISKSRELLFEYDDVMKGKKAENFAQLKDLLDEDEPCFVIEGLDKVKKQFWDYQYPTIDDLANAIKNRINE